MISKWALYHETHWISDRKQNMMKKYYIILGNGFTIDFINHFKKYCSQKDITAPDIDVQNLFSYGSKIVNPWSKTPGFLSYQTCPALWTLGARPHLSAKESNDLIEEVISCANMFFDFVNDPDQKAKRLSMTTDMANKIYLRAYCELNSYLRELFATYNNKVTDDEIALFCKETDWGWVNFLKECKSSESKITFVTYNYDVWLERILKALDMDFSVAGFESEQSNVFLIKPHGSISFVPIKADEKPGIAYWIDFDGGYSFEAMKLQYEDLLKYSEGAIIPPAGDSGRLESISAWASKLREEARTTAHDYSKLEQEAQNVVICGLSYWHVDRHEIDEILINLNQKANLYFINPNPPRDMNAVLMSIFSNYVLLTSSENLKEIANG